MPKKKQQYNNLIDHRYGLFMTKESFDLDIMYGREWLKKDNVQEINLYKVNIIETKSHSLYGQAKASDKKYFSPVRLSALIIVESNVNKNYGDEKGGIARNDTGNLIANIFIKELEEKNIDINRGDIIEYNISGQKNRYYEVENAQDVVDSSDKTRAGFEVFYKQVISVPVKEDIVPFLQETK